MIQRIQTLYLLLAVIVFSLMFFFPLATLGTEDRVLELEIYGFCAGEEELAQAGGLFSWGYYLLLPITCLLLLFDIFQFNNRILQRNIIRFCYVLELLIIGLTVYVVYMGPAMVEGDFTIAYELGAVLPLIGLILTYMAGRRIMADENLVRSADRLRD